MNLPASALCFVIVLLSTTYGFRINLKEKFANSCVKCHNTDPNRINVHLVHHSHDDVGWIKTVDQYFWGLNNSLVNVGVQYIITSVVNALWDHPDRRFIQVETAFFWKWWRSQDDVMRNKFKTLVDNGQLEIVNGGWVMNDEACVNYQSTIDQFTLGFRALNETLGHCGNPTVGWQIDPFGHSREHASILSKIGFDGLFFARLDENDRKKRKLDRDMDFLWQTSANNDNSILFSGMFGSDNIYYPPTGFCFDVMCNDDAIDDDPENDAYNLDYKVSDFASNIESYAKYYRTNNVLITMGGDFQYQAAEINFQNSDKLMRAFKNHPEINLIYSTPSCYIRAVYEAQPSLLTKTDDFFPYGSANHSYWAGYFTSRQNFKRLERTSLNMLQVAKQLTSLAFATNQVGVKLGPLRKLTEAVGVAQHHDAITGTAQQHVSQDYTKILARSIANTEEEFTDLLGKLLDVDLPSYTRLRSCLLANISICSTSQNSDEFLVVAYNPLSWPVSHTVRLPVEEESFTICTNEGQVSCDIMKPISNFSYVKLENVQPSKQELVFVASEIPPLGMKIYRIKKDTSEMKNMIQHDLDNTFKFGNEDIGFEIDNSTNLLKTVTMNGITMPISQQFLYYNSTSRENTAKDNSDPSGAYIFRPRGTAILFDNPTIIFKAQGTVVEEIHQRYNDWITQIIRVYKESQNYIEFDWLVGPIKLGNNSGMEVISRFTVEDFKNNQTFYTDSNGREMIKRVLNYRPTYSYNSSIEPIASNYYPVTSKIVIRDKQKKLQVAVLNDRSQGGSSLAEGQIELMVHRRTLTDDSKGVGEALNDTEFEQGIVARGQHYLVIGPVNKTLTDGKTVMAQERVLAQQMLLQPWIGVGDISQLSEEIISHILDIKYSALRSSLPANVNILTLQPWTNSSYLLRLEHILEKNEDPSLSSSVTVDLSDLFANFTVTNIVEMTLGANRRLDSMKNTYDWSYTGSLESPKPSLSGSEVILSPMDIKTFIVGLSSK